MKSAKLNSFIGIDFGLRRIGIATGQVFSQSASILTTLAYHPDGSHFLKLDQIIQEWQPDALVVGVPLNQDGSSSDFAARVLEFIHQLEARYGLPVIRQNEHASSQEAQNTLKHQRAMGHNKHRIKKTDIDKLAAAIILQRYLDSL